MLTILRRLCQSSRDLICACTDVCRCARCVCACVQDVIRSDDVERMIRKKHSEMTALGQPVYSHTENDQDATANVHNSHSIHVPSHLPDLLCLIRSQE